jgi:hypothetical protein
MKLICYPMHASGPRPEIRPAPPLRNWMLATDQAFATRCLPLTIANSHGWELLCPAGFDAIWSGGRHMADLAIVPHDAAGGWEPVSIFGHGVLTLHPMVLVRTEPGVNLWVQGPVNAPKDGIQALTGLIETDWSPFSFTMNWQFTRPCRVTFRQGEPFCHFFPLPRHFVEAVEPELRPIEEAPELKAQHTLFVENRRRFNEELGVTGSAAQQEKWQKQYYRGLLPDGRPGEPAHQVKLRVRPFADHTAEGPAPPAPD